MFTYSETQIKSVHYQFQVVNIAPTKCCVRTSAIYAVNP